MAVEILAGTCNIYDGIFNSLDNNGIWLKNGTTHIYGGYFGSAGGIGIDLNGELLDVRPNLYIHNAMCKKSAFVNPFTDVKEGDFFYDPVVWAVENGITNGVSEMLFGSDQSCLRAHVVTFLHRAVGNPEPASANNPFTDVKPSDFFYKPVLWAVEKGITNGISATQFGSANVCNRASVVTFLWRAMGSPEPETVGNPFVDVKSTDFFYKAVLWSVENKITNGVDATHFSPAGTCNRAQVVTFLYRAYN